MITLERSPGQVAYEAFGDQVGWLLAADERIPFWHELDDAGREVWEHVALAVKRDLAHPSRDTLPAEPRFDQDEIPTQVQGSRPPPAVPAR